MIITFGIVLFLGLQNISAVAGVCRTALGLLMPLIIGFCAAFILNVLLKVIEERLFAPLNRKNFRLWSRLRRIVSIILTFGIIIGLVFILIFMIVPELKRAFSLLVENMPQYSMQVKEWITKAAAFLKVDASTLTNLEIDWEKSALPWWITSSAIPASWSTPRLVLPLLFSARFLTLFSESFSPSIS